MTSEPPHPLPQSTVQAAGQAASDVVQGLKQQPMLLALVVLNAIAIIVAVWFLRGLQEQARAQTDRIMSIVEKCVNAP